MIKVSKDKSIYQYSAASFSECEQFRYWLIREWDGNFPLMASIGLNPSVATHEINDHTVTKDIQFAKNHGFGGLLKLNIGAYRSTDPVKWRKAPDPIGPLNTSGDLISYLAQFNVAMIVAAWGKNGNYARHQCREIIRDIPGMFCFGRNTDLTPRHTLMLPYCTPLERFN